MTNTATDILKANPCLATDWFKSESGRWEFLQAFGELLGLKPGTAEMAAFIASGMTGGAEGEMPDAVSQETRAMLAGMFSVNDTEDAMFCTVIRHAGDGWTATGMGVTKEISQRVAIEDLAEVIDAKFTEDSFVSFTGVARETDVSKLIEKLGHWTSDFYVNTYQGPLKRSW